MFQEVSHVQYIHTCVHFHNWKTCRATAILLGPAAVENADVLGSASTNCQSHCSHCEEPCKLVGLNANCHRQGTTMHCCYWDSCRYSHFFRTCPDSFGFFLFLLFFLARIELRSFLKYKDTPFLVCLMLESTDLLTLLAHRPKYVTLRFIFSDFQSLGHPGPVHA